MREIVSEEIRLENLKSYNLSDLDKENVYDDVVNIASMICDAPISLITLLEKDRQWFLAKKGTEISETPRSIALCNEMLISNEDVLIVPDLMLDDRFKDNQLVTGETGLRFYAAAPLLNPDGIKLGSVCVIDTKPREFTLEQVSCLMSLSKLVMSNLELKRKTNDLKSYLNQLKTLSGILPICIYCKSIKNEDGYWERLETFIRDKSSAEFTHCVCSDCLAKAQAVS